MSRSQAFFAPVALVGLLLAACSSHSNGAGPGTTPGTTPPSTEDGGLDASVSDGGDAAAGDGGVTLTLVTEPDQGMTPIYNFISSATKTLDMTMYELSDTTATGLLATAAANGVTVRVILDQNLEMSDNTTAYNALAAANVQVHWANPTYAATHQKTITVDGKTSAIMTLNFASEDYATSRDFAVFTDDAADIGAIEEVFNDDFKNATVTPPTGDDLVWSPTNAKNALVGLIGGAKTSLLVENEEMSDDSIVAALVSAASRGVNVEVAMEDSSDYAAEFAELQSVGAKVRVYRHASLYIHAKVVLSDFGTSAAKVFVGSENFSNASLTENRELGLITSNAAIMTLLDGTLTSDFNGGTTYAPDAGTPLEAGADADAATDAADAADGGSEPDAETSD